MSNPQFTKAEELQMNISNDISMLLIIENDLIKSLENNQLNLDEKTKILNKIKSVSDMRVNLYGILDQTNNYLQSTLINSRDTLKDQSVALQIIENEVNASTNRLKQLQEDKYNKYRQVEINTYYSHKYSEHNKLLLWIIGILAILTFIVFLNKKNIISYTMYFWLLLITIILGLILIFYKLKDINKRNNMNYQEYDIDINTEKYKQITKTSPQKNKVDPWEANIIEAPICVNK